MNIIDYNNNIINQVISRLNEMNCEHISNDGNMFTFKCLNCGAIRTESKIMINKEYATKRMRVCRNCDYSPITLDSLIEKTKLNNNTKSLIATIKESKYYIQELISRTQYLPKSADIIERLYNVYYNINEVQLCPFCNEKPLKWSGRFLDGYKETCCSKECTSKLLASQKEGLTIISEKRDKKFIEWQNSVTTIDDEIVKEHIKYRKYASLITNPIIINYLKHRLVDTDNIEEVIDRINKGLTAEKPRCENPNCNNYVNYTYKTSSPYTRFCCKSCSATSESTKNERKATNLEHWGTENVYDSEKYKQQHMDEYGVPYVFLRKEVIEKRNATNLKKFGTIYPTQTQEVKNSIRETNQERYGVDWTFFIDEVFEKAHSKETREKIVATNIERYGANTPTKNKDVQEKSRRAMLERYGVEYMFLDPSVFAKAHSKESLDKARNTNMIRYGVEYPFTTDEARRKSFETLRLNNKLQTSKAEDEIYEIIKSVYKDCEHHHFDDVFPYNVDFYIPSLNLYIEYQGSHFHNRRAFFGSKDDTIEYNEILEKANKQRNENGKDGQYAAMLYTWTDLDVRKRNEAFDKNLNYLEIYSYKNADDILNQIAFYVACLKKIRPISYSDEVLENEFEYYKSLPQITTEEMQNAKIGRMNSIVKHFQFCEFYKNEMYIYAHDPIKRRKVIQNRIKYLEKKECDLTPMDIILGFKRSGVYYGYSHFNPIWTKWFVDRYNIRNICDPCGGWGHHLLGMLNCEHICYNDLDQNVCDNIKDMKEHFNINNLIISNNDARSFTPPIECDGWFMCPPYYNVEVYSDGGYDSIEEYKSLIDGIFSNWEQSSASFFGVIIREDLYGLINRTADEIFDFNIQESHFSKNAPKIYKERFYIFKK